METIFFYYYCGKKYILLLEDAYLGWFRVCHEKWFLVVQRRAETTPDLPLCLNKWYILKLNSYDSNFTSRIILVTWINHSRFLFLLCASLRGTLSLELVFSSAFWRRFISYIVLLIKEVSVIVTAIWQSPHKVGGTHVCRTWFSWDLGEPWHLFLPDRVPEVCNLTITRPSVSLFNCTEVDLSVY